MTHFVSLFFRDLTKNLDVVSFLLEEVLTVPETATSLI